MTTKSVLTSALAGLLSVTFAAGAAHATGWSPAKRITNMLTAEGKSVKRAVSGGTWKEQNGTERGTASVQFHNGTIHSYVVDKDGGGLKIRHQNNVTKLALKKAPAGAKLGDATKQGLSGMTERGNVRLGVGKGKRAHNQIVVIGNGGGGAYVSSRLGDAADGK